MTSPLAILGATGSIGRQTLDVSANLGLEVACVAALHASSELLEIARVNPSATVIVVGDSHSRRADFAEAAPNKVLFGPESMIEVIASESLTVVNGIVGAAGLKATLAALQAGNRVALANKESLVAGGPLVQAALEQGGGELVPVDSEHSAIFQCLQGEPEGAAVRLILTASGGPFRTWSADKMATATVQDALRHPTWDMGQRITVDSATMFNKGLEIIEAHWLFGFEYDAIDVVVHPQSIVHSAVAFRDGSLKAHLGNADMRTPIQYALTFPERAPEPGAPFDLADSSLDFHRPDPDRFPALAISREAGRTGGTAPAVLNAADEVAVAAFLQGRLGFLGIAEVVGKTLDSMGHSEVRDVDSVIEADQEARALAASLISGMC